ncbi:MAG: c-type cytochrome [Candidatus Eisenbacteria bacterium]|uniref:C-type cytochrome n=1 Tax=Eiseniibacteriota bacterium TaxID=2212470 RepID=A0A933SDZ6_UNCEI|nr:c-type cytochrome [Candidatus Eisenbacteria bacterium]
MRLPVYALLSVTALSVVLALSSAPSQAQGPGGMSGGPGGPGGQGGPGQGERRGAGMGMAMGAAPDSFAAERDSVIKEVLARIGNPDAPADSVFKNLKVMKGRTVTQVLGAMNSFGRNLGVSCKHCHVNNHWADEDKKPKQITRDMIAMTRAINDSLLAKIDFGGAEKPRVMCFTCHRGQPKPAGGMRPGMGGPGGPGGRGPGGPGAPGMPGGGGNR